MVFAAAPVVAAVLCYSTVYSTQYCTVEISCFGGRTGKRFLLHKFVYTRVLV